MLRTRKNKKTTKSSAKTKKQSIFKRGLGRLPRSKSKLLLLATASVLVLSTVAYSGLYLMQYRELKHAQAAYRWGPRLQVSNSGLWFQACKTRRDSGYGPLYDVHVLFAQPGGAGWSVGVTGLRNGQRVAQDFYPAGWYNGVAMRSITVSAYLNDQIVIAGGNSRFNGTPLIYEFGPFNPTVYARDC